MTVGEMIDFLAQFDREAVVLVGGNSGTPDRWAVLIRDEWVEVEFEDGSSEEMLASELAGLDEGSYAIKARQPLFWPS